MQEIVEGVHCAIYGAMLYNFAFASIAFADDNFSSYIRKKSTCRFYKNS